MSSPHLLSALSLPCCHFPSSRESQVKAGFSSTEQIWISQALVSKTAYSVQNPNADTTYYLWKAFLKCLYLTKRGKPERKLIYL